MGAVVAAAGGTVTLGTVGLGVTVGVTASFELQPVSAIVRISAHTRRIAFALFMGFGCLHV